MATITLTNPVYYYAGTATSDPWVGFTSTDYRTVRYEFTAPSGGVSHVQLKITQALYLSGSDAQYHDFVFYIGTSPTSHTNVSPTSPYTGTLTMTWATDGSSYSEFNGEADITLNSDTKYYVWIFSISEAYSGRYTNYGFGDAISTITTSGSAGGFIYIDNGGGTTSSGSSTEQFSLSNPTYYQDGASGASALVGWDGIYYRIARYEFTTPNVSTSRVKLDFSNVYFWAGTSIDHSRLCFYIGTSSTSHAAANANSSYTGTINVAKESNNATYSFTGEANITLNPNTKYYVWIFSNSPNSAYEFCYYSVESATKTITISSTTSSITSASFEKYQVYIDNGSSWDLYVPYIDNGSSWDAYG